MRNAKDQASKANLNHKPNAALLLADGTVFFGFGVGKKSTTVGEVCFNTSMTGYQEIITDPSYAGQIINFTFPHIGNTGTNAEDIETKTPHARGIILCNAITNPSNYRNTQHLNDWLEQNNITGITGIDTRALTKYIRKNGAPNGVIVWPVDEKTDLKPFIDQAKNWPGLENMDLAKDVTCEKSFTWNQTGWNITTGYGANDNPRFHVVAIDYGAKLNILRCLADVGCKITVVPATTTAKEIFELKPDGVFLSNGPGDPSATGEYAIPVIQQIIENNIPLFGICLGHQLLALAIGAKTEKMHQGHRGANHPVKNLQTGKVEITSQNHGFMVLEKSLPANAELTHISLFDKTVEGLRLKDKPAYSVQHHPEASPGPQDAFYLFNDFITMMERHAKKN